MVMKIIYILYGEKGNKMHMIFNQILVITPSCPALSANDLLKSNVLSENGVIILNDLMKSRESMK